MLAEAAAEEAAAAAALGVRRVGTMDDLRCLDEDLEDRCGSQQPARAPQAGHTMAPLANGAGCSC